MDHHTTQSDRSPPGDPPAVATAAPDDDRFPIVSRLRRARDRAIKLTGRRTFTAHVPWEQHTDFEAEIKALAETMTLAEAHGPKRATYEIMGMQVRYGGGEVCVINPAGRRFSGEPG